MCVCVFHVSRGESWHVLVLFFSLNHPEFTGNGSVRGSKKRSQGQSRESELMHGCVSVNFECPIPLRCFLLAKQR